MADARNIWYLSPLVIGTFSLGNCRCTENEIDLPPEPEPVVEKLDAGFDIPDDEDEKDKDEVPEEVPEPEGFLNDVDLGSSILGDVVCFRVSEGTDGYNLAKLPLDKEWSDAGTFRYSTIDADVDVVHVCSPINEGESFDDANLACAVAGYVKDREKADYHSVAVPKRTENGREVSFSFSDGLAGMICRLSIDVSTSGDNKNRSLYFAVALDERVEGETEEAPTRWRFGR